MYQLSLPHCDENRLLTAHSLWLAFFRPIPLFFRLNFVDQVILALEVMVDRGRRVFDRLRDSAHRGRRVAVAYEEVPSGIHDALAGLLVLALSTFGGSHDRSVYGSGRPDKASPSGYGVKVLNGVRYVKGRLVSHRPAGGI